MNYKKSRNRDSIPPTIVVAASTTVNVSQLIFSEPVTSIWELQDPSDGINAWSIVDSKGRPYELSFLQFTFSNTLDFQFANTTEDSFFSGRNYYLRYNSTVGSWTDFKLPPLKNKLAEIDGTDITLTLNSPATPPTLSYAGLGWNISTFACGLQQTGSGTTTNSRSTVSYSLKPDSSYVENASTESVWVDARWDGSTPYADDGAGNLLDPLPYVAVYPSDTNYCRYSRDLTSATWTKANGMTATYNQVGLTGESNTATLLTAGQNNALATYSPLSTASNVIIFWIKRVTGTGVISGSLSTTSSPNWVDLNVPTETGVWHRVGVFQATEGTYLGLRINTENDQIIIGNINASSDAVVTDISVSIAKDFPPIFTYTATVTRNVDAITATSIPYNSTGIEFFCEAKPWLGATCAILQLGTTYNLYYIYSAGSTIRLLDTGGATSSDSQTLSTDLDVDIFFKAGSSTTAKELKVINSLGEGTWDSSTYSGALGTTGTLSIYKTPTREQKIRRIRFWSHSGAAVKTIQRDGYYI